VLTLCRAVQLSEPWMSLVGFPAQSSPRPFIHVGVTKLLAAGGSAERHGSHTDLGVRRLERQEGPG
jgi:hypothetical protein